MDCFAGVGGNAIAFALSGRWKRVYAIERDAQVLACARHNAEIYGVASKISWYEGDCFEVMKNELADLHEYCVVFASPPWGGRSNHHMGVIALLTKAGPSYRSDAVFDLLHMQPYTLFDLLVLLQNYTNNIVLYLPRTSDLRQLAKTNQKGIKLTVVHYCMEGASKVVRL